jgi:hypothetical protein
MGQYCGELSYCQAYLSSPASILEPSGHALRYVDFRVVLRQAVCQSGSHLLISLWFVQILGRVSGSHTKPEYMKRGKTIGERVIVASRASGPLV